MFKIGEFSKIAQVPDHVLRYYDRIGILAPNHIDPESGYRYYSAQQLPRLNRILTLKELGLSLDQIRQMVDSDISAEEIRGMLMLRKAQIAQSLQEEVARLRTIESRLAHMEAEGDLPTDDVVLKSAPAQPFLSLRSMLPALTDGWELVAEMTHMLPTSRLRRSVGHLAAIFHSEMFREEDVDLELGFLLEGKSTDRYQGVTLPLPSGPTMAVRELPAVGSMATVVRLGGTEHNHRSYGAIGRWAEANGYQLTGLAREVVLMPPQTAEMDDAVTEVQFPVEKIDRPLTPFLP